jgi:hypothetical protein
MVLNGHRAVRSMLVRIEPDAVDFQGRCPWLYVSRFAIEGATRGLGAVRVIHPSQCDCALIPERDLV